MALSEIIEVFGKRGKGKTLFMSCNAAMALQDNGLFLECCSTIRQLNEDGHNYSFPDRPPVYSNYRIEIPYGYKQTLCSYYVDGFHFGFENDDVPVIPVAPCSQVFLAEGQRYYNSKSGGLKLPDWVSRAYEESRHFDLSIMIDVQRPVLIEANIREIADIYIEVLAFRRNTNKHGFVVSTDFLVREFDSWKDVSAYMDGVGEKFEDKIISFPFDGFGIYNSKSYFRSWLPSEGKDFMYVEHLPENTSEEDLAVFKWMYPQEAPEGFYKTNKR